MAAFEYIALDLDGRKKKGVLEGDTPRQIRQQLREQGLIPIEVFAVSDSKSRHLPQVFSLRIHRISTANLALFLRHLATLLVASMPLEEALAAVAEQFEKPQIKSIILGVRAAVLEGHTLADALGRFPSAFPPLCCATVAAGEQTGHLDEILLRLADYIEQQQHLRQKAEQALIYPALMTIVSLAIVVFLLMYVVPKMVSVFSDSGQTLPMITRILIAVSHSVAVAGPYFLLMLIALTLVVHRLLKREHFRLSWDRTLLKIPLLSYAIRLTNSARFMRTFGILSSAGVAVLDAMRIATNLVNNLPIRKAIQNSILRVKEGTPISQALKTTTYFSPISLHLIASGEMSGRLEMMLQRAATHEENAVTRLFETGLSLFEPLLILLMGSVVLFIVLAVLLPIFSLYQFVGQ